MPHRGFQNNVWLWFAFANAMHSSIPWFANSPASTSTLAFLVHSISTLPPFLFPAFPVTVDPTIYLLSQQPFKDTDFFIFLFPVSDACVLLIAYCSLCHFPFCSGLSLEILLAFLLLVNIVLISQYLVPALYTPLTLGVSLFPFFFLFSWVFQPNASFFFCENL